MDCFYGGLLRPEVAIGHEYTFAEVVEGEAEVLLVDELFIDSGDHLKKALVLLLQLLLLQVQVDLAVALLLVFDLELLFLGKLLEDPTQGQRKLLGKALADGLNRFWGFSTEDVPDGLLIALLEELVNLLSQLSRHCSTRVLYITHPFIQSSNTARIAALICRDGFSSMAGKFDIISYK